MLICTILRECLCTHIHTITRNVHVVSTAVHSFQNKLSGTHKGMTHTMNNHPKININAYLVNVVEVQMNAGWPIHTSQRRIYISTRLIPQRSSEYGGGR